MAATWLSVSLVALVCLGTGRAERGDVAAIVGSHGQPLHRRHSSSVLGLDDVDGSAGSGQGGVEASDAGYTEVWRDDFDGTEIDHGKWEVVRNGHPSNGEKEFYTERRDNSWVEGGVLTLKAKRENYGGKQFTSAFVKSRADWTYAKITFRAKLSGAGVKGYWPALWMMPRHSKYGNWPHSGEIDILEEVGYEGNTVHGTINTGAFNHKKSTQKSNKIQVNVGEWHEYTLDWREDVMEWFVDGKRYHTFAKQGGHEEWPFDMNFYIIMNVAVGGEWGAAKGMDDQAFEHGQTLEIDFVSVKRKTSDGHEPAAPAHGGGEPASPAGGDDCSKGGSVWNAQAGEHTCGQRIHYINKYESKTLDEAKRQIAKEFSQCSACAGGSESHAPAAPPSHFSGGDDCSKGGSVWNAQAGEYTCGQRIHYINKYESKTLDEAKRQIAKEFSQCSACAGGSESHAPAAPPSHFSGSAACSPGGSVWDTEAGGYTCGKWVNHLVECDHVTVDDAKQEVAIKYSQCRACGRGSAADHRDGQTPATSAPHVPDTEAAPTRSPASGGDECSEGGSVWNIKVTSKVGTYTCGERILHDVDCHHKSLEEAKQTVARKYPQCGACAGGSAGASGGGDCTEGGPVWNTKAGEYTCGQRIHYLNKFKGKSLEESGRQIAKEYAQCGACGKGPPGGAHEDSHPASPPSVPVPVPQQTARGLKVGLGYNTRLMKHRLDPKVAGRKLAEFGVHTVRMWDYEAPLLQGLLEAGIMDVLVNVPLGQVTPLSQGSSIAKQVVGVLRPFHKQGMKLRVGVGNEPLAGWQGERNPYAQHLAPAMENLLAELHAQGMTDVTVAVPFFAGVVGNTYPPSHGAFKDQYKATIAGVAKIIHRTGGEFIIHQYPFFARNDNPRDIHLDFALGETKGHAGGTTYLGLLGQMLAAARAALINLDREYASMPMTIGESGWPSAGHRDASVSNLCTFARHALTEAPDMDPHLRSFYLFEAFDEGNKAREGSGGHHREYENHFGIMTEDGSPKCPGLSLK